jgi:hypothetical protein
MDFSASGLAKCGVGVFPARLSPESIPYVCLPFYLVAGPDSLAVPFNLMRISMSASVQLKPTSRATDKQRRKAVAADRKRQAAAAARLRDESRDELLAPQIQRLPILGRDGEVIKNARLERDGISFRVSSPIRHMVARSKSKDAPLLRAGRPIRAKTYASVLHAMLWVSLAAV